MNNSTPNTIISIEDGGPVYLWKGFLNSEFSQKAFKELQQLTWGQEIIKMYGKEYLATRKTTSMGNPGTSYSYSGKTSEPLPTWHPIVLEIKTLVESVTKEDYNYALLNYYEDGNSKIGFHADDEKDLDSNSGISSISLGCSRDFQIKKNGRGTRSTNIPLDNGDLLLMSGNTQKNYKHSVPVRKRVDQPRINITFRKINL